MTHLSFPRRDDDLSHNPCPAPETFRCLARDRFKAADTPDAAATTAAPATAAVVEERTECGDEILTVTVPSAAGDGGGGGGGGGGGTRAVFNMTEGCLFRLQLLGSSDGDAGGGAADVDLLDTSDRRGQGADAREDQDQVRGARRDAVSWCFVLGVFRGLHAVLLVSARGSSLRSTDWSDQLRSPNERGGDTTHLKNTSERVSYKSFNGRAADRERSLRRSHPAFHLVPVACVPRPLPLSNAPCLGRSSPTPTNLEKL